MTPDNSFEEPTEDDVIPPQYRGMSREVVEELWQRPVYLDPEKNKEEQERRDKALEAISRKEQAKQPAAENASETQESAVQLETYEGLPNVEQGFKAINEKLNVENPDWDLIKRNIYDMLTTRSGYAGLMAQHGNDLPKMLEGLKDEREAYNDLVRDKMKSWVDGSSGEYKWESNPGWFGINTRPEAPRREAVNIKTYVTIPTEQYPFVEHIPALAQELRKLSLDTDDIIQVKVPENFATFISKNDSIVVHYKNLDNSNKIQGVLDAWMSQYGIQEEPREMDRVKVAADAKNESFSDLVASNITNWLKQQHGKYDSSTLAQLAVKYAIEQSQTPPELQ
jgi:hypothetical protein